MKTFTQEKKDALLAEIIRHQEADQIIQGTYGNDKSGKYWKGCAVGCAIHSLNKLEGKKFKLGDHHVYETELGIPESLSHLEDRLFEWMPQENALTWPARFIAAVPALTDLSLVLPAFYIRILTDNEHGVRQWASDDGKKAIDQVVKVHKSHIAIGIRDEEAASSAYSVARSAASSAYSVYSAAYSAARSAAASARSAQYVWMSDVLIECLENSQITTKV